MLRRAGLLGRALVLSVVLGGVPLGCGGAVVHAVSANNRLVQEWSDALASTPPPPQSERMGWVRSQFGLLEGNGNHCDIRVTLDLLTRLSASEVTQYYRDSGLLERLGPSRRGAISLRVWVSSDPWADGRALVRVELFGHGGNMGDGGGFDPRCH